MAKAAKKELMEQLNGRDIRLIRDGWAIKKQMDDLKNQLDAIQQKLIEAHGPASLIVPGECRVIISEREALEISDVAGLKAVLGDRFDDLVKTRTTHVPSDKLKEMAVDGDDPKRDAIGACLTVKVSQSITWRAEK